jgi:hypothetical protein
MRPNKFGIRGMKRVWLKGRFVYFWMPPVSLQKAGVFRHATLTDFDIVVTKAREWNAKLDAHLLWRPLVATMALSSETANYPL